MNQNLPPVLLRNIVGQNTKVVTVEWTRWLVVESNWRRDADPRKLENKLKKTEIEAQNKLRELSKIEFACEADAAAAHRLSKQLKYYNLTQINSRQVTVKPEPKFPASATGKLGSSLRFKVQSQLEADAGTIDISTKSCGRFILASNTNFLNSCYK